MRTEDGYIVNRCLNGDSAAFGFLMDKYKASVYAYAYHKLGNYHDAEDVTQDVFIRAYQKLRTLRRYDSFLAWLYCITSNTCKMLIRSRSRRPDREFMEDKEQDILDRPSMDSYREEQTRKSLNEKTNEALASLPEMYSQALTLYYLGGMDTKEIARFVGASPTAIRKRLSKARSLLRAETMSMISAEFRERRLQATFTFRLLEAIKRAKMHPMPRTAGLPWGFSLAVGTIIAILVLNPHLSTYIPPATLSGSPLMVKAKTPKTGEIPVDILEVSPAPVIASNQGKDDNGAPKSPEPQNSASDAKSALPDDENALATESASEKLTDPSIRPTNRALRLSEEGDSIRLFSDLALPSKNITMEAWISPADEGGTFIKYMDRNGHQEIPVPGYSTSRDWYHVAATYDGSVVRGYLDGAITGESLIAGMDIPMVIGASRDTIGISFRGLIDEIRIWNVALTQDQIQTNMDAPLTGQEHGLLGYWNFDDGTLKNLSSGDESIPYGNAQIVEASQPKMPDTAPILDGEMPVDYIWIDLGKRNEGFLLIQREGSDGITLHDVKSGVDCRKSPFPYDGLKSNHIYFAIDDSFLHGGKNEVWIVIEYFDAGDWINCHYDSVDEAFKHQGMKLSNTETWKIHAWRIEDGRFENRVNGSDFRLSTNRHGDMWINRVWVLTFKPYFPFDPDNPGKRKVSYSVENEEFYNTYYTQGDAYWNEDNGYFVLTRPEKRQAGKFFFTSAFEMRNWIAGFEMRIWGGSTGCGAGMTFAFVRNYIYKDHDGASLNFGGEGYGVEFDTYANSDEVRGHHIGLLKDDSSNHLETVIIPRGLRDNSWRHVFIVFTDGRISAYYDGREVISGYSIPDYTAFAGYFGFTATTGGNYEWHAVRNIRIAQTLKSAHDVMVTAVTAPGDEVESAKPVIPRARIFNLSANDEVDIPVTCEIKAAGKKIYFSSQTIEDIASLKFRDVRFAEWIPQKDGKYDVTVSVSLSGDENQDNDSVVHTVAAIPPTDLNQ